MRKLSKLLLTYVVDLWARIARFSFPEKYTWRWKLDMLAERYEKETTGLLKDIIKPGMTVVDIGAHIGYFTRLAGKRVGPRGHVYAFEPEPDNRSLLEKNVHSYSSVSVGPEAITSKVGNVPFYHVHGSTGCHSTIPQLNTSEFTVPATTLDAFVEARRITHIDVIKMDIEGGEYMALLGMEKTLSMNGLQIIMEYNTDALETSHTDGEKILTHFVSRGFSIDAITARGLQRLQSPYAESLRTHIGSEGSINILCKRA